MPGGTGLLAFQQKYPNRTFDVGIAEEHAVSMAGGLAKQGMIPVVAIYSTFLQRSLDQIFQDACMLHLHVVFAIDRAGLVGDDGPTHHGVFDVGFLRMAPGMLILAPVNFAEQRDMLCWAVESYDGPVAIRYPRGGEGAYRESDWDVPSEVQNRGIVKCHRQGTDVTLLTYGSMFANVLEAADVLEKEGISVCVLRLLTLSVFPVEDILREMAPGRPLIVVEEAASGSGVRDALASELREADESCRVTGLDLGKEYVPGGSMKELYRFCGLDSGAIAAFAEEVLRSEG